jgi:serine phosphatase RsbU (regulator of sigma subunit)
MRSRFSRSMGILISLMAGICTLLALSLAFHWGPGRGLLDPERVVWNLGRLLGITLILLMAHLRPRFVGNAELWSGSERLGWTLVGVGFITVAVGGAILRYLATIGQRGFIVWTSPSIPAFCIAIAPLLTVLGLLFLPLPTTGSRRILILLDCAISTSSLFTIVWFLLLGRLTLSSARPLIARLMYAYMPIMDILIVSCVLYTLLHTFVLTNAPSHSVSNVQRSTGTAYRISLLVLGLGLTVYGVTDFIVNLTLNLGIFRGNDTWSDLGWTIAPMIAGLAAYLRRFLPTIMNDEGEAHTKRPVLYIHLLIQFLPYLLALFPMLVLILNGFSSQPDQQVIRPVLVLVTLLVVCLVLIRQIITMAENERLIKKQVVTLEQLEQTSCELARHVALRAELCVAAKIQTQLLPRQVPQVAELDIFAHSRPAEQVGGDFYDVSSQPDRPFVFVLGDISGHGLPAALLMTMTRTIFHTATRSLPLLDPQTILQRTNEDLYEDFTEVGMFVTVFVGCYDACSAQFWYANAGHAPVIYCPKGGTATLLKADAPMLGVLPTSTYTNHLLPFQEGDLLLVGTDGLNESFNAQEEMFGYDRLLKAVEMLAPLPAQGVGCELLRIIELFTQGHQQSDDQTFIVLKGKAA